MKREFKEHISMRCQTFGECWLRVKRAYLTGNPSEEDLIEATKAEFEKTSGYQAIQGQREQVEGLHYRDKADTWVNSWKVLWVIDKYSGAAALAASGGARGGPPGNPCDEDEDFVVPNGDEEGAMNPAKRAGEFQIRPTGTRAAKAARTTEVALVQQAAATTNVLESYLVVSRDKVDQAFWTGPDVRNTAEAATWRRIEAQDRLAAFLARRAARIGDGAAGTAAAQPRRASPTLDLPDLPASPTPGRDARVAGEAAAIAAAPTLPASPKIDMPDLPAPPTPGRSLAARADSDGASGGLGHTAPGGAAPAVFCLETDDEVGMDATLRTGRAGVTDGARRRTRNGNGAADVAVAGTAAAFVPTARMELEAVPDVAVFYDQGAAAVVPAAPAEQEPADNAESAYQEAAARALERLTRADAAGADLRGTSDEGARSGMPVTARVADAALTLLPARANGTDSDGDAGNVRQRKRRPFAQPRPRRAPATRTATRGRRSQATKQSALERSLKRAAAAAGMDPSKLDVSTEEESTDGGFSTGSVTV
ncbi:hypothetical protein I4F81_009751 [Pyropia yezoensis]|uniref:Uncharacterized protein n=1 Tax=Pyropia yezoensis TaxID=2788 RepID=A0ACC3CAE5_PYRYE|nr:hypothetical protein I4F81_009751 [Neopyropia yezoensis]